MGCDIHVYLEFWHTEKKCWISIYPDPPPKGRPPEERWRNASWGDYTDFPSDVEMLSWAHTAPRDVAEPQQAPGWHFGRDYAAFGYLAGVRGEGPAFEEPRDLPADASLGVWREYALRVVESEDDSVDGCTTKEYADRWVASNGEKYIRIAGVTYVTHPDWHSASYYTLAELSSHLQNSDADSGLIRVRALRAVMRKMAKRYETSEEEIRVCFWFDN
jgi:hypothetical protein